MEKENIDKSHEYNCKDDCIQPVEQGIVLFSFLVLFLPEQPFHLLGDMEVEDYYKAELFYRIDDCFKCLWVIHGKVCENLTVQTDILLSKLAHKLRI